MPIPPPKYIEVFYGGKRDRRDMEYISRHWCGYLKANSIGANFKAANDNVPYNAMRMAA